MSIPTGTGTAVPAGRRESRLARLRALLARDGTMRLETAARALDVSTMTLRRDLADSDNSVELLGGTLVARGQVEAPAYTLDVEQGSHRSGKQEAGRRAALRVRAGDTVFIDCGTTMPHLIAALPADLEITIVCYALNIATLASRMSRAQLFLLGGLYHSASATFFSEDAVRGLLHVGINMAFMSAGGVHEAHGASCSNFNEVPVKRAVLEHAMQAVLVADSSKLGQVKPARFARLSSFAEIITELP